MLGAAHRKRKKEDNSQIVDRLMEVAAPRAEGDCFGEILLCILKFIIIIITLIIYFNNYLKNI